MNFCGIVLSLLFISQRKVGGVAGSGHELLEYGEHCGGDGTTPASTCNQKSQLRCVKGSCGCAPTTFYDKKSKACKNVIGKSCTTNDNCSPNATCRSYKLSMEIGMVHLPASLQRKLYQTGLAGSIESHKTCACPTGYAPDSLRWGCVKTGLQFEETCSEKLRKSGLECDVSMGFTCNSENICTCQGTTIYDKEFQRCVARLGEKCDKGTPCEEGAICPPMLAQVKRVLEAYGVISRSTYNQIFEQRRSGDRCICSVGLSANKEGKCVGSYKTECSEDVPCNADGFLSCVDGFCQCEKGTTEIFVEGNGTAPACQLTVGSACSDKKGPTCAGHSVCKSGQCKCTEGSSLAPSGNCLMNHGSTCKVTPTTAGCNFFQGLACIGAECSCFDSSLKWNEKEKMCVADEGNRCGKFKTAQGGNFAGPPDPGTGEAEFYVAGCEHGFTCTKDEKSSFSGCKKVER